MSKPENTPEQDARAANSAESRERQEPEPADRTAPRQTTTGAVNRDLESERAREAARSRTFSTAEPAATMDIHSATGPGRTDQDAMSGDAVRTRPQTTPMQPTPTQQPGPAVTPEQSAGTSQPSQSGQSTPADGGTPAADGQDTVLAPETSRRLRERWRAVQAEFVDDPRRAVEDADRLLSEAAGAFASGLEERRRALTSGWEQDGHGETEQLRLTMHHYRALVDAVLR